MYDSNNHVVKLCSQGMGLAGEGKNEEALALFQQAWHESTNDFEKFTAAHYIARHQKNTEDKLTWDETALALALQVNQERVNGALSSLYLNVAKGYEDINDVEKAREHYELARSFTSFLSTDGYGEMIKSGIANGIQRVST